MNEFKVQGRIVWGHPGKAETAKDPITRQVKLSKTTGKEYDQWSFGLAVDKAEFMAKVWPIMSGVAQTAFPQGPDKDFAWKYKDGDTSVDKKGNPFNQMEGRAGCMILSISTSAYAPPLYKMNDATGQYDQITAEQIKCGDHVLLIGNIKFNGVNGIYINPEGVIFAGYDTEISSSSFDVNSAMSNVQVQLPQGASATPIMSGAPLPNTGVVLPQAAPAQAAVTAAPVAPQPIAQAAATLPPPAAGFVANAGQQPAATPMAGPPQAVVPVAVPQPVGVASPTPMAHGVSAAPANAAMPLPVGR